MNRRRIEKRLLGFTIIEFVITMTLTSLLFAVVSMFITRPITAYTDVVRRGTLIDSAGSAVQRLASDLSNAVPNSVRFKTSGTKTAIEFMQTVEAIPYHTVLGTNRFEFGNDFNNFATLGRLQNSTINNATCSARKCRIIVNNPGNYGSDTDNPSDGMNVYSLKDTNGSASLYGPVTITPAATTVTLDQNTAPTESVIDMQFGTAGVNFQGSGSPNRYVYIADTPVTYICDSSTGLLTRYWNYTITAAQPINPSSAPLSSAGVNSAVLANNISTCIFDYTPATSTFNGVVSLALTFSKGSDTTRIMQQIALKNKL